MEKRNHPLDALSGLAMLGIVFASLIPSGTLPAWMYHAQTPPPSMVHDPGIYGLTWVDVVLPLFLFVMGVSIPIALTKRCPPPNAQNQPWTQGWLSVWGAVFIRSAIILFLAVAVGHLKANRSDVREGLLLSILWFASMCLLAVRFPRSVPPPVATALKTIGFAVTLYATIQPPYNSSLNDPILAVIANVTFTGSIIWILTRNSKFGRIATFGVLAAALASSQDPGFVQDVWQRVLIPDLIELRYQQYLLIVIPALYVGEALMANHKSVSLFARGLGALQAIIGVGGVVAAYALDIQFNDLASTWILLAILAANSLWTVRNEPLDRRVHQIGWGMLLIGFLLEPAGGGVRKDPATLSFLLLCCGIAALAYATIGFLHSLFPQAEQVHVSAEAFDKYGEQVAGLSAKPTFRAGVLALVGENSLLVYLMMTNLLVPILVLSGLQQQINQLNFEPWTGAGVAAVQTLAIAFIAYLASRLKIFVRP